MSDILLSVIIPVYNVQEYLEECICSVISQTYKNIEIIIIDDGSTDLSAYICDKYAEMDHRIVVVHKTNGGLVSARKTGVSIATGEYVMFVDGDDWLDMDACENLMRNIASDRSFDIIAYGLIEEYGDYNCNVRNNVQAGEYKGEKLSKLKNEMFMGDVFFEWNILPHLCDKIIRIDIIRKVIKRVPDDIVFGEDAAATFPSMFEAQNVLISDLTPYHYRQRKGSIVKGEKELEQGGIRGLYRVLNAAFQGMEGMAAELRLYMFFVLCLKGYSMIHSDMALFPFCRVKSRCRIYVYGAGGFGRVVEAYVRKAERLFLAGWTDKRAEALRQQGQNVDPLDTMFQKEYEYIVIAVLNESVAEEIKMELIGNGIPEDKIDYVKKEVLERQSLPEWLTS